MIYTLYNIFRILIYPLVRYIAPVVSKKVKARVNFEHQNFLRQAAVEHAHYAFEISSEGEYEQVFPVIESLLLQDKAVEIVYSSDSVDSKIKALAAKYPHQIRAQILPIVGYRPWSRMHNSARWLTADNLFLCRYDFFPELIYFGSRKTQNFVLLSATMKNFENKNFFAKVYFRYCLKKFTKIVAVSQLEKERLVSLAGIDPTKIEVYDFRIVQIEKRLNSYQQTLDEKWPLWRDFQAQLRKNQKPSAIFGSFWNHDFSLIKDVYQNNNLCIVPHKLGEKELTELRNLFVKNQIAYREIKADDQKIDENFEGVYLINIKGILCELYKLFDQAYVGGGFGISIHSVLEPYIAGCNVLVGPKNHRSSEYDLIREYDKNMIESFSDRDQLVKALNNKIEISNSHEDFVYHYRGHLDALLMWLEVGDKLA